MDYSCDGPVTVDKNLLSPDYYLTLSLLFNSLLCTRPSSNGGRVRHIRGYSVLTAKEKCLEEKI